MASIRNLLALLRAANEESISAWQQDVVRAARDRIDRHISEVVKTVVLRIRRRLQDMARSKAANRLLSGCSEGSAVDRIRTVLTNMLRSKLEELLTGVRQRIMEDFMKEVRHHYYTVTAEVPSDEVLEKMFAEGKSEEMLRRALYSSGRGRNAAHYINGGTKELNSANTYQRRSCKWFCIDFILLLVLVLPSIISLCTPNDHCLVQDPG
ncbi:hypothetical protein M5K25_015133 [Dendrobium thyrsiflorum]|uniref:Uncharacterized protein n=1 Tax=Dendrobium thyrsiflorum TaxID=117978 RepID=A0ABD0UWB5_DENTH